jgi:glycosyltransferase involved in cell wall biosynthesis
MTNVSIVIPLFNEEESLPELCTWIEKVCTENGLTFEIILVDDGSKDQSWEVIKKLKNEIRNLKGISFRRNYGKSAALNEGFKSAKGEVVITMDADLQDSPDEIPELYDMIKNQGFDLVSGWKQKRYDPPSKTIPTKLFNYATRKMSGISLHDFNCGLKAYKNDVVKSIEVYGEMHRYIPVLAKQAGFGNITEKVVQHRARKYGTTKFGLERFVNGFLDLLTITFISKFGKRPMHFFGTIGILFFLLGLATTFWVILDKIITKARGIGYTPVTSNTYFYIALAATIIGMQLFLAGYLGELIARNGSERNSYNIKETID